MTDQLQLESLKYPASVVVRAFVEEDEGRRHEVATVQETTYEFAVEALKEQGVKNLDLAYVRGPEGWEQPDALSLAECLEAAEVDYRLEQAIEEGACPNEGGFVA